MLSNGAYLSISSPTMIPGGNLPSLRAFSSRTISSKSLLFSIISRSFFFSLSVSFSLDSFDDSDDWPLTLPFATDTSNALDLVPRIYPGAIQISNVIDPSLTWYESVPGRKPYRRRQLCRCRLGAEQLLALLPLCVLDLLEVEEADSRAPPDHPVPVVL